VRETLRDNGVGAVVEARAAEEVEDDALEVMVAFVVVYDVAAYASSVDLFRPFVTDWLLPSRAVIMRSAAHPGIISPSLVAAAASQYTFLSFPSLYQTYHFSSTFLY
jgi:hypothetical protein